MHTYIIGKKTKVLMNETQCPGVEICHMNMEAEEIGHMCCVIQKKLYFIYIIKGAMAFQINQERVEVYRGEGLFINSGAFYRFAGGIAGGCEFYLFTVSVNMIEGLLSAQYTRPILESGSFPYLKFSLREEEGRKILEYLEKSGEIAMNDTICPELEVNSLIYQTWASLFRIYKGEESTSKKTVLREVEKLRKMLEYLHNNYRNKITLTEMAENLGISSGDYCRFFKKHMGQTPFEYLQTYRIERTLPELLEKTSSITEISLKHGFNGSSYYAETFRKEMGCTPGEFRKWYLGEGEVPCPLKAVQVGNVKKENKAVTHIPVKKTTEEMPMHLL